MDSLSGEALTTYSAERKSTLPLPPLNSLTDGPLEPSPSIPLQKTQLQAHAGTRPRTARGYGGEPRIKTETWNQPV